MKKLLTLILVLCSIVGSAQMRGGSQYDPGAARSSLSNVDATATPSMTSITLSDKVKAAWADILGDIYASGTVKVSTGTAAAPAYSFASDPNTGVYSPAADNLAVSVAGAEALRVNSAGEMLIATSTDAGNYKLQVNGSALVGTHDNGYSLYISRYNSTDYKMGRIVAGDSDRNTDVGLEINVRNSDGVGVQACRFFGTTNVGIATSTDDVSNKVQVAGAVKSFINQHGAIKSHFAQVGTSSPATSTLIVFGLPNSTEGASVLVETVGHSYGGKYTTWKAFIGCQNNSGTIAVSNASLSMTQVENIGTPITAPIITTEIAGTQVTVKATFSGPYARYSSMVNAAGYVDNPR